MLLRASGEATRTKVDLGVVMTGRDPTNTEIPHGEILLKFAEAAVAGGEEEMVAARQAVLTELGPAELVDAAAVVGNFERNVRVADATGIPLDDFLEELSADFRSEMGVDAFASKANDQQPEVEELEGT